MNTAKLTSIVTFSDGKLSVGVDTYHKTLEIHVRIDGGPTLVLGEDPVYTTPFVDGETYTVEVQMLMLSGLCPPTTFTLVAGEMDWGSLNPVGYSIDDAGSVTNDVVVVAVPIPEKGPVTPTSRHALVPYAVGRWGPFMPNHPSVTYDPEFNPPDVDDTFQWLYHKAADGEERLRLVRGPSYEDQPQAHTKMGPDGGLYWVTLTPEYPGGGVGVVRLHRAQPVPYGQNPEPPTVHLEFTVDDAGWVRFFDVFWDENDAPTLVAAQADQVHVRTPEGYVVYENTVAHAGLGVVHTSNGFFLCNGGNPI